MDIIEQSVMKAVMPSGWHDSFHDRLLNDVHGQSLSTMSIMRQIIGLHEYSDWGDPYNSRTQAVKYMVSHDEQSILQEMVTFNSYSIEEASFFDGITIKRYHFL